MINHDQLDIPMRGSFLDEMTKAEFNDGFTDGDAAVFEAADADKNGTVGHDEWEDWKASQGYVEGEEHG